MYASKKEKYESISKGVINLEEEIDKMNSKLSIKSIFCNVSFISEDFKKNKFLLYKKKSFFSK